MTNSTLEVPLLEVPGPMPPHPGGPDIVPPPSDPVPPAPTPEPGPTPDPVPPSPGPDPIPAPGAPEQPPQMGR